jgi:uncharacterized protein YcbK (DUF882 family)
MAVTCVLSVLFQLRAPVGGAEELPAKAVDASSASPASDRERIRAIDPTRAPALQLKLARTRETHEIALFDEDGRLRHDALAELRTVLFDPKTGIDHPIHWRLATLLVAIQAHFPGSTIEVVSGYRNVGRHTDRSNHTRGRAIDMRVVVDGKRMDNRRIFELLRASFAEVGVGYYPNGTFVHLDVRDRATIWVDYSGAGEVPCYSRSPARDLADGTAERTSYEQAITTGCRKAG